MTYHGIRVCLLSSLIIILASGCVTPPEDLKLYEWRLAARGELDAVMVPSYAHRAPAVKVTFPSLPSGRQSLNDDIGLEPHADRNHARPSKLSPFSRRRNGWVLLNKYEIYRPLVPFIPPYIGLTAKKVVISLCPVKGNGNTYLLLECLQQAPWPVSRRLIAKQVHLNKLPPNQWTDVTFDIKADASQRLAEVRCRVTATTPDANIQFYLANPRVIYQDNQVYEILNSQEPKLLQGMKKPLVDRITRPLPQRDQIHIGFGSNWGFTRDATYFGEISQFMKSYFPEYDIVLSCSQSPEPKVAATLPKLPENLFYQFQKAKHGLVWLDLHDALPKDWRGRPQTKIFNSILATNPILRNSLKEQMDYAATIGVNNFKSYDYVWPYLGGRWGYDHATVSAFREDLDQQDEGLQLINEKTRKLETLHFWDYFNSLHGMTFKPQDLGLEDWNDYTPTTEQVIANSTDLRLKRNYSVFLALCHYEWLRQAQRFHTWAKAHGGTYDYLLNGEHWGNANDHLTLLRLKDAGIVAPEFFIHYPANLESAYRGFGRYLRCATRIGKKMGVCLEITTGGGGGHPYWDAKVGYAISYGLRALGFINLHHDCHNHWKLQNSNDRTGFNLFMVQASAFRRAKLDQAQKIQAPQVLQLITRPVGVKIDSFLVEKQLRTSNQQDFWNPALLDAQINFEQIDDAELPLMMDNAKVIFYAPPVSRKNTTERLEAWLDKGGKTLVTHTYIPFSLDCGRADYDVLLQEPGQRNGKPLFKGFDNGKPVGQTVLTDSTGNPLLTRIPRPRGSKIYYLHISPKNGPQPDVDKAMAFLTKDLKLPLVQQPDRQDNAMALRFHNPDTMITVLWNKRLTAQAHDRQAQWHRTVWQGKRKYFDPTKYLYNYTQPGAACSATIKVDQPGNYRVYRFLDDSETVCNVGTDRLLRLPLKDALVDVFYAAPDTQRFRQEVAQVKQHRRMIAPYFVEQPKWDGPKQKR